VEWTVGIDVRPMTPGDVDEAIAMAGIALADGPEERERMRNRPPEWFAARRRRHLHVLGTDGPGAWVAEDAGRIIGVALALRRERLWILSLLAVDEAYQGIRLGRQLLDRALAYGAGCRAWMTVSSTHPAAIRSYARAGMRLSPTLTARGVPRPLDTPVDADVREGTEEDLTLAREVDAAVRGVPHGDDLRVMLEMEPGVRFLVLDGDGGLGYALEKQGTTWLLAATDEAIAASLLRASLAGASGESVEITWISAHQNWAVPVVLEAGLYLEPGGCVCAGGDVGPLAPYLPSGPFL
jgi:GNAT superfamily N-acetyltransferase